MQSKKLIPGGKVDVLQSGDGMKITMKLPRNILLIQFLCFWLFGWAIVVAAIAKDLLPLILLPLIMKTKNLADIPESGIQGILFLGFWTFGGFVTIFTILRSFFGRDVIIIDSSKISISPKIGGIGITKVYDIANISNLRIAENEPSSRELTSWNQDNYTNLTLTFDHKGKTVRLAKGLSMEEAEALLEVIWNNSSLDRKNYAESVTRSKVGEETHWEDRESWEDWKNIQSGESEAIESATKSIERINADKEALAQDEMQQRIN